MCLRSRPPGRSVCFTAMPAPSCTSRIASSIWKTWSSSMGMRIPARCMPTCPPRSAFSNSGKQACGKTPPCCSAPPCPVKCRARRVTRWQTKSSAIPQAKATCRISSGTRIGTSQGDYNNGGKFCRTQTACLRFWPPRLHGTRGTRFNLSNKEAGVRHCWRPSSCAGVRRAGGKTRHLLLPLDTGQRLSRKRWDIRDDYAERMTMFFDIVAHAVQAAGHELDSLSGAHERMRLKIKDAPKNSRLPALVDLMVAKPIVSIPLACKKLHISKQALRMMIPRLGSTPREITERRRYRCWSVV